MGKFFKAMGTIDPIAGAFGNMLDTPKSPRVADAPPPPPAPAAPPAVGTPPAVPSQASQEAQAAAVQAQADADQRRRRSTFLTGPSGIPDEKFGNPSDTSRPGLVGGGNPRSLFGG